MRRTCDACSDTQEPIRGISNARREDREGRTRITNNHCLAYNCAANVHEEAKMSSEHAHGPDAGTPWKHDGVRVVPADQLDPNTAQTPGMNRKAAINFARVGAQKLWAGTVHIHPDAKTGAHHHGPLESVIYVVSGRARMRWGERLEFTAEAGPGDFIYVPPFVPHEEINASPDSELSCVVVRSGQEPVVVNLDMPAVEESPEEVHWVDDIHRAPGDST